MYTVVVQFDFVGIAGDCLEVVGHICQQLIRFLHKRLNVVHLDCQGLSHFFKVHRFEAFVFLHCTIVN